MTFKLLNQQPQTFYSTKPNIPLIDVSIAQDEYDRQLKAHAFELFVRPLYTPAKSNAQVSIKDSVSGVELKPIEFTEALLHFLKTDVIDQDLTDDLRELYEQGTTHSLVSELSFDQFMVLEALASQSMPYPEAGRVIYTPGEVKDAAGLLLSEMNKVSSSQIDQLRTDWFGKLGAYVSQFKLSNFRLITVKNHQVFNDLKTNMKKYLKQNVQLPKDTAKHLSQFDDLSIQGELSIGLFLPNELNNDPYGFNRILENEVAKMERRAIPNLFSETYSLKGMLRPTKIVILNLEEHTTGRNLQKEWQQIVRAFNNTHKIRHIKHKNLQTVQAVDRIPQAPADYTGGDLAHGKDAFKSQRISYLTKKQMTAQQLIKRIENISKKQTVNQVTSNLKKRQKNTFMRANRRNPDDINAQGKVTSTIYSPDLHIWLDTSGSISKMDYENEIQTMIAIAKHMNVDIYFNSFSHVVSETTKIPTKDRTPRQIFGLIERIDKVSGGTDFINVWEAIDKTEVQNIKNGQARRIHLILSDMDYRIPTSYTLQSHRPSVKNTYYLPIRIRTAADRKYLHQFAKSLEQQGGKGHATGHVLF